MPSPEQQAMYERHVQHALQLNDESNWHDFKVGLLRKKGQNAPQTSNIGDLRKDIVALANTVDGPYDGFGYIIIGVQDKTWVPVGIQPTDQYPSLDQLRNAVMPMAQTSISPPVAVDVAVVRVPGTDTDGQDVVLHVIAVPQTPLQWHVSTSDESLGAWVRDHHASVRPLRLQHDQYLQRIVNHATQALQQAQAELQQNVIRLNDEIAQLTAIQNPEALSATQLVRTHFRGNEQRLQRLTRDELQTFREAMQVFHDHSEALALGPTLSETQATPQWRDDLNRCLAEGEQAVRPLIELMSSLIHTVPPDRLARTIAREIYAMVGFTSNSALKLPGFAFALRTYPTQLFLQASAMATVGAEPEETWTYFRDLLAVSVELPSLQHPRSGTLLSHLVFREPLNHLLALANHSSAASNPFNMRAAQLTGPGWTGDVQPVLGLERRTWEGEALLSLGYCISAVYRSRTPPPIQMQWWTFTDAPGLLYNTLNRLMEHEDIFTTRTLLEAGEIFDQMDKVGNHLRNTAVQTLKEMEYHP